MLLDLAVNLGGPGVNGGCGVFCALLALGTPKIVTWSKLYIVLFKVRYTFLLL